MSDRDELALVLANAQRVRNGSSKLPSANQCSRLAFDDADAILAAGYRKPWTITTAVQRAALIPGTICMDSAGNAWKRGAGSWVGTGEGAPLWDHEDLDLTVLWEPQP